jgi:phosphoenolpyruvate-protein kinase (PTS system EI component)
MSEQLLRGHSASPGIGAGPAHLLDPHISDDASCAVPLSERPAAVERAELALDQAATAVTALARRLEDEGRAEEATIVETGAALASDPALRRAVREAILEEGRSAAGAILEAADELAATLAALEDPMLAARADDVRSVARRAARAAVGGEAGDSDTNGWPEGVLIASDLGPADVAELGSRLGGVALAGGALTAHAAIVARSLGVPMVVGAGAEVLAVTEGEPIVVDASEGVVVRSPSLARAAQARLAGAARSEARSRAAARRDLPAVTTDGRVVRVLANVASAPEVVLALESGAEGIGLLRTELSFLDARGWPSTDEHQRELEPVLGALGPRVATVRVLDFGGDKLPSFLQGKTERGIELLLDAPEALDSQLRAILAAAGECELRLLLPMVGSPEQARWVRDALVRAAEIVPAAAVPELGAMIETTEAVARVEEIAEVVDFLSIGTNDLSASILNRDRFADGELAAREPSVLAAIDTVARAAHDTGIAVEVCGEAASDPSLMPLLVGLGIGELSVGAARVGEVRAWVRALSQLECTTLARRALRARSGADVTAITSVVADQLGSAEFRDAAGERLNGGGSVVSLSPDD